MSLAWKNITGRRGRSITLILLSSLIALAIFTGTVAARSMKNGVDNLRERLGADLIVVPGDSDADVETLLIKGKPGYFYMDSDNLDTVRNIRHVETASSQLFLTTASTGCCAMPVQLIGFEPDTDFTVQPWIAASYEKELNDGDILIGHNLTPEGRTIVFYGTECNIAGRLAATGTDFDNAVYTNMETLRTLMQASVERGFNYLIDEDAPDELISSIFIRVDSYENISEVKKDLNVRLDGVKVIQTSGMLTATMENMTHMSGVIEALIIAIWVLSFAVLMVAYVMLIGERKKEFAIFRTVGASARDVTAMIFKEALMIGLIGGAVGISVGCVIVLPFSKAIENVLGMPFMIPAAGHIAVLAIMGIAGTVLSGLAAVCLSLPGVIGRDAGILIREGE